MLARMRNTRTLSRESHCSSRQHKNWLYVIKYKPRESMNFVFSELPTYLVVVIVVMLMESQLKMQRGFINGSQRLDYKFIFNNFYGYTCVWVFCTTY